jgi:hypothetical protein
VEAEQYNLIFSLVGISVIIAAVIFFPGRHSKLMGEKTKIETFCLQLFFADIADAVPV